MSGSGLVQELKGKSQNGRGKRILIIEGGTWDGLEMSRALKHRLGGGHRVEIYPLANMALTRVQDEPFDLIIVDTHLPAGIDGLNFICLARQICPQTDAMLIPAHNSPQVQIQARCLGIACLPKPFSLPEFVVAVQRVLDEKSENTVDDGHRYQQ